MEYRDLDYEYVAELYQRQQDLQVEAQEIIHELDIVSRLAVVGEVYQIGSLVSGLMVWRDIDFTIVCRQRSSLDIFNAMLPILSDEHVIKVEFLNEMGLHEPSGKPEDERLYFVLRYETAPGHIWKMDFSFWFTMEGRGEIMHPHQLREQLTEETRLAILWLKDLWRRSPNYPYEVGGYEIYDAVLNFDVRTPERLRAYLIAHGLPVD